MASDKMSYLYIWITTEVNGNFFHWGATKNQSLQESIARENDDYHDIVQGDFLDSYRNLSYKNIMGKLWVSQFCKQVFWSMRKLEFYIVFAGQVFGEDRRRPVHWPLRGAGHDSEVLQVSPLHEGEVPAVPRLEGGDNPGETLIEHSSCLEWLLSSLSEIPAASGLWRTRSFQRSRPITPPTVLAGSTSPTPAQQPPWLRPPPGSGSSGLTTSGWRATLLGTSTSPTSTWWNIGPWIRASCCSTSQYRTPPSTMRTSCLVRWTGTRRCPSPCTGEPPGATTSTASTTSTGSSSPTRAVCS